MTTMTLPEAHKFFRDTFGVALNPFLDGMMMALTGKVIIDIGKFDDFLREKPGDSETSNISMEAILRTKYGKPVLAKMRQLLGIDE
jgi:hypothetical protein